MNSSCIKGYKGSSDLYQIICSSYIRKIDISLLENYYYTIYKDISIMEV